MMIGNNKLIINQATMQSIVQAYLTKGMITSLGNVTNIMSSTNPDGEVCYHIVLEGKKLPTPTIAPTSPITQLKAKKEPRHAKEIIDYEDEEDDEDEEIIDEEDDL